MPAKTKDAQLMILDELVGIRQRLLAQLDANLTDIECKVTRWRYKDLTARGRGGRKKIWQDVKRGAFPQPLHDYNGDPYWTPEQILAFDENHDNGVDPEAA